LQARNILMELVEMTTDNKILNAKVIRIIGMNYAILKEYLDAEKSFKKAIELNSKDSYSWFELGRINHYDLQNFKETEECYRQAISIDGNVADYWYSLGELYKNNLFKFEEAEKAYNKAILLNGKDENYFNALGNLYQDNLIDYKKAERAYKKALVIYEKALSPKLNLMLLNEAEELFNSIEVENDTYDSYWLNKTLFDLYKRNEGNANESILNALSKIDTTLPDNTQDDWWRFGAIVTKLGYGNWLLTIFEEKGFDIILSPYYVALKAMNVKDAEGYLNSKAVEIRDPAIKLMEIMKYYL